MILKNDPASFKDDAGKVFYFEDRIFRTINNTYSNEYEYLKKNNIYESLIEKKFLIKSWEVNNDISKEININSKNIYKPKVMCWSIK